MFPNQFEADNSLFGAVLTDVMDAHGIKVGDFLAECKVQNQRVIKIKKASAILA